MGERGNYFSNDSNTVYIFPIYPQNVNENKIEQINSQLGINLPLYTLPLPSHLVCLLSLEMVSTHFIRTEVAL